MNAHSIVTTSKTVQVSRPFVQGRSSGIYIFEFANGQRYVGQTVHFAGRFPAHIRGSDHHEAWEDITRLMVMDAKPADLDELEFQIIAWQKDEGYSLRNKTFNFGFEGPSQLDSAIPIIDQLHWQMATPTMTSRISVKQWTAPWKATQSYIKAPRGSSRGWMKPPMTRLGPRLPMPFVPTWVRLSLGLSPKLPNSKVSIGQSQIIPTPWEVDSRPST